MPPIKRLQRNTGPWSSQRILNASSPIVETDIHTFLATTISGWNADAETYTEAEKRSIIDSLPPAHRKYETDQKGQLKCPLSTDFVLNDLFIKAATQQFKNDVGDGYYEKSWQNQASKAMQERREGRFDAYLREHAEECFGDLGRPNGEVDVGDSIQEGADSCDEEWTAKKSVNAKSGGQTNDAARTQVLLQNRKI